MQIVAGVGSDQTALGIGGYWRYRSTTASAAMPGGATNGTYTLWATCSGNSFALPDTDSTDYNFYLTILATGTPTGNTPAGNPIVAFRKVGTLDFSSGGIVRIRQLTGQDDATMPLGPTAPRAVTTPVTIRGAAGQTARLLEVGSSASAGDLLTVSPAGQLALPVAGSGAGVLLGGDALLYRKGAGVIGATSFVDAASGFRVGGTALAASHLSNGTTGTGSVVLSASTGTSPQFATPALFDDTSAAATTAFVQDAIKANSVRLLGWMFCEHYDSVSPNVIATLRATNLPLSHSGRRCLAFYLNSMQVDGSPGPTTVPNGSGSGVMLDGSGYAAFTRQDLLNEPFHIAHGYDFGVLSGSHVWNAYVGNANNPVTVRLRGRGMLWVFEVV